MNVHKAVLSFIQSWTERAKGESDPKKRKREDEGQVNEQMESNEGSAKKKSHWILRLNSLRLHLTRNST